MRRDLGIKGFRGSGVQELIPDVFMQNSIILSHF